MELPGFVGPSYTLRSRSVSSQRSVNLYPEANELAQGKWQLISTPGMRTLATVGNGPHRGMWKAANGRAFTVSGDTLYEITVPTAAVNRGTIQTNSGRVSMADNVGHLVIVDGRFGYAFKFSDNSLTVITDPEFPVATSVAFLDQYILVNAEGSGRFQYSALNDATDWDGLDVATAEGSPDNLVALAVDHRQAILMGEKTTEIWYNTGGADNAFSRFQGAFVEHGIAGKHLHSLIDNTRLWWSQDSNGNLLAMRLNGYQAEIISTIPITEMAQDSGSVVDGTCWAFQDSKHAFWVTNFPGLNTSLVFDASNGMWHEMASLVNGNYARHRAECHVFHNGMHIVGDYENGNIYELDNDTHDFAGSPKVRERSWPAAKVEGKRVFYNKLRLDCESGVGLTSGQGDDPQIMLQYSDDGGKSWSDELWTALGKMGDRTLNPEWRRLGESNDRVFRVKVSDPVPLTMIAAWVDLEGGSH